MLFQPTLLSRSRRQRRHGWRRPTTTSWTDGWPWSVRVIYERTVFNIATFNETVWIFRRIFVRDFSLISAIIIWLTIAGITGLSSICHLVTVISLFLCPDPLILDQRIWISLINSEFTRTSRQRRRPTSTPIRCRLPVFSLINGRWYRAMRKTRLRRRTVLPERIWPGDW